MVDEGSPSNLSSENAAADRLHHIGLHDSLTGLPNRGLLERRIEQAALAAEQTHMSAAVLFADLDQFRQVNETYGHDVGDELLIAVAHRLSALIRPTDTLARVSGAEFIFVCGELRSTADVDVLVKRITGAFAEPFQLDGAVLEITSKVGIAYAGPGEKISTDLISEADHAMCESKRLRAARDPREAADVGTTTDRRRRNRFENDLRAALAGDLLHVAYQPIVRTGDGLVTGVEALLRWTCPDRGPVPPLSIVAVAEQSELIGEIGAWVLERGCRDRRRWLIEHPGIELDLAVNVSARQLTGSDFYHVVTSALARTRVDPAALVLEMTESLFIEETDQVMGVLADLKALGIRLALDDFGSGYSSMSYLNRLPLDIVKIDQTLVEDIASPPAQAIVAAVTDLAHVLGFSVTAEGVESRAQHHQVRALGCEHAQGHFYGRPMPAAAISAHLGASPRSGTRRTLPRLRRLVAS